MSIKVVKHLDGNPHNNDLDNLEVAVVPSNKQIMGCGHVANGKLLTGAPICGICVGIDPRSEQIISTPDLTGRQARCSCGKTVPSNTNLAFFEFRGPGSRFALETCKCGYGLMAHDPEAMGQNVPSNRKTVVEQGKCTGFVSRGAHEFDSYYDGHGGWD